MRNKRKHFVLITLLVVSVLCGAFSLKCENGDNHVTKAETQQDIIDDIISRLTRQGIPIKSANVTSSAHFEIEVIVQSASTGDKVLPDDPQYIHSIQRELTLGKKYSIDIQSITTNLVNSGGKTIYWAKVPIDLDTGVLVPFKLDEQTLGDLRNAIEKHEGQMTLTNIESTYDNFGMPLVAINLQVKDIKEANALLWEFMNNLGNDIDAINTQRAQIAVYQVKLNTTGGELILQYVNDLQLHSQRWWQADGLDELNAPLPAPAAS